MAMVVINGRVVDLNSETTVPDSPKRKWVRAREVLEEASWSPEATLNFVRSTDPRALLMGLEEAFRRCDPNVICSALTRLASEHDVRATEWLETMRSVLPEKRAPVADLLCTGSGLGRFLGELARVVDWTAAIDRTKQLVPF